MIIKRKQGFTLIELITVIVILGILAVIILPRFIGLNKKAEESIAKHLEGSLKEAHEMYFIRLVLEAPSGIDPITNSGSFWTFVDLGSSGSDRDTIRIDQSIRNLLQDQNAILWQPDGTLLLEFKSGAQAVYYINSSTGAISAEYSGF